MDKYPNSNNVMKNSVLLLSILSLFLFLDSCKAPEREMSYRIVETYRIKSSPESKTHLFVDLPVSYGYQVIGDIIVENAEDYFFEDRDDYRTLHANVRGNGKEKVVTVKYDVTLLRAKTSWSDEPKEKYLSPEEFIDSDDKNIVELANILKVTGNAYQTAKNISRYASKKIKFDYSNDTNGRTPLASEVLKNKKGICRDYVNLTTALLRATGIPAKSVSGLVLNKRKMSSDWSSPAGSHAWVEFRIDGEWYFADPTWGNRYFTYSDGYHLSYGSQPVNLDSRLYQAEMNRSENTGLSLIGAMTAPIKFMAWSEDEHATITPKVDIAKNSLQDKLENNKTHVFEKEKPSVFNQPERE